MRRLLLLMVVAAFFESASVAAVLPFLELAADPEALLRRPALARIASALGVVSHRDALLVFGAGTLATLVLSNLTGACAQLWSARFAWGTYRSLGRRLLATYLDAPYVTHLERSQPDLVRGVLSESGNFVSGWIQPSLQFISRALIVVLLVATLVVVEPVAALTALLMLGGAYGGILAASRRKLDRLGRARDEANQCLHQGVTEAFAAFREVRMYETADSIHEAFDRDARAFSRAMASVHGISVLPKYFVEVLALGAVVGLAVSMAGAERASASTVAFLGLFALAGYRLVPALQTCFQSVTSMRFAKPSLERLARDLGAARTDHGMACVPAGPTRVPQHDFGLDRVTFQYPGASGPALRGVTLAVRMGATTALMGPTGSGKSTLLDLLLGLTEPSLGSLWADGRPLDTADLPAWRRNFAYISQVPVLLDTTVAANIAFGVPGEQVDLERVRDAARLACIDEFIEGELPLGYQTLVGDRGARLSGGQRQRIAIARALYTRRPIVVLDEATNALDDTTEAALIDRLRNPDLGLTLLCVTHRAGTASRFQSLLHIANGTVRSTGESTAVAPQLVERAPPD